MQLRVGLRRQLSIRDNETNLRVRLLCQRLILCGFQFVLCMAGNCGSSALLMLAIPWRSGASVGHFCPWFSTGVAAP